MSSVSLNKNKSTTPTEDIAMSGFEKSTLKYYVAKGPPPTPILIHGVDAEK